MIELALANPTYVDTMGTATLTFTNPDDPSSPVDPTTVAVEYKQGNAWTTYNYPSTISRVSEGIYTLEFPITSAGQGIVRGIGTGTCAVVEVAYFQAIDGPKAPS